MVSKTKWFVSHGRANPPLPLPLTQTPTLTRTLALTLTLALILTLAVTLTLTTTPQYIDGKLKSTQTKPFTKLKNQGGGIYDFGPQYIVMHYQGNSNNHFGRGDIGVCTYMRRHSSQHA